MICPATLRANRRRLLCGCAGLAAAALAGCQRSGSGDSSARTPPAEITATASCSLDGMLLADFPGPKGQIHYAHDTQVYWFCDTLELLSTLVAPEQIRAVNAAYVTDMGRPASPTASATAVWAAASAV